MLTRCSHLVLSSLLVAAVVLSGCAKRPATTQAAAPAPTGSASTTAATPPAPAPVQSAPPTAATTTPAPSSTARPAVQDFAAVPELADVFFDFDKYDIRPGDAKTLDANANWLKSNPNHLVLIEGHCDERGTNEYNLALGERRAKSTMNYLVSQGVQANRITIISYGEERPQCTEHNEACWAKNRRAHFLVKPR
ncbi:MAG TPA: peptidoglycan-associated lipoprotein Pal [Gammaproteobacteria bacterium]|jgi:peptidoglycan-associated lipoprotein|nr:peptidoglycan-associated lipoprotein Pal [Gammaproteobacteria bacterium]